MELLRFLLKCGLFSFLALLLFNGCATTGHQDLMRFPAMATQDDSREHYLPGSFRYAIWNFHRPEFQQENNEDVAKAILADIAKRAPSKAVAEAMTQKMLTPINPEDPDGPNPMKETIKGLKTIYGYMQAAMIPADNGKIAAINQQLATGVDTPVIKAIRGQLKALGQDQIPSLTGIQDYTPAQRRFRALLLVARSQANAFFAELRINEPVFFIPGDGDDVPLYKKERPTYLVARDRDVVEALGGDTIPPSDEATVPPYTTVTYTHPMETVTHGPYMLSGEGRDANKEKPGMHKVVNQRQGHGDGMSRQAGQQQVREVVRRLTLNALKAHASPDRNGKIDIAKHVSRQVPMGMVRDYFGFYPPDLYTQIQWSRNTQNSFFHDPLDLKAWDGDAILSGKEMNSYISQSLLPELKDQLAKGRPAYDSLGMMLKGHADRVNPAQEERIVTNTMGLLVGAGETTTTAVNRALHVLLKPENGTRLAMAVRLAKELQVENDQDKNTPLDQLIWEALRFNPINPWVERNATKDHTISPYLENPQGEDKRSEAVTIVKGSRVFLSTQSAMFDTDRFAETPFEFLTDRDLDQYIHMSVNYHRCLGDDVALAMVPEIIKQILANLEGLKNPDQAQPAAPQGVPFPETWTLSYNQKTAGVRGNANWLKSARDFLFDKVKRNVNGVDGELKTIQSYIRATDTQDRVLGEVKVDPKTQQSVIVKKPERFDFAFFQTRNKALDRVYEAMIASSALKTQAACRGMRVDSWNSFQAEACKKLPIEFNICYFLQRTGGQKSPQHAFNYCHYNKGLLGEEGLQAAAELYNDEGAENFYFLKYLL